MTVRVLEGDCRAVLPTLPDASVDSIVTDPPYHLTNESGGPHGCETPYSRSRAGAGRTGFMGRAWDGGDVAFDPATWRECLRVLKPGGHLLAFGGTRTYHRLAVAVEDAGFEIRDRIVYYYDSEIDRSAFLDSLSSEQRELFLRAYGCPSELQWVFGSGFPKSRNQHGDWEGWGTALKPAHEPIVVARKRLIGTVAANVMQHGCGALNIDGCRVEATGETITNHARGADSAVSKGIYGNSSAQATHQTEGQARGRWPANVIHDGSVQVIEAFPAQAGADAPVRGTEPSGPTQNVYGTFARGAGAFYGDTGSAARFFYCAKASREDRCVGGVNNTHPTVKPTELMRYLCRLVTPPGGIVLDPFAGSGTTGRAADIEGFDAILIEREAEYVAVARRRIRGDVPLLEGAT